MKKTEFLDCEPCASVLDELSSVSRSATLPNEVLQKRGAGRSEVRGQRSEARDQRSEAQGRGPEVGCRKTETPGQELSHSEWKPVAREGRISGITAERDEYVGVPPRPGTPKTPGQELSHSEWKPKTPERRISGITAERDEYVGVPPRPGTPKTPGQELSIRNGSRKREKGGFQASRRSAMSTLVSHRGRARLRRRPPNCPIRD